MKDYKLLLVGLISLLVAIFIALLTWLWTSNHKNTDPLPIMTNEKQPASAANEENTDTSSDSTLSIRAEQSLQVPIDDVIVSFESRYPHIQVLANYIPANTLLTISNDERSDLISDTDIIIANNELSKERLSPLQEKLKATQHSSNQNQTGANSVNSNTDDDKTDNDDITPNSTNKEARTLTSFNYALKDNQALEGVVLTDNPVAVSFRNFLLSSAGQTILEKYEYYNINGYENSVNDLFEPSSQASKASGNNPVNVADALGNSESQ